MGRFMTPQGPRPRFLHPSLGVGVPFGAAGRAPPGVHTRSTHCRATAQTKGTLTVIIIRCAAKCGQLQENMPVPLAPRAG
jgi:hypothetical protein